jgi:hypothetical protein
MIAHSSINDTANADVQVPVQSAKKEIGSRQFNPALAVDWFELIRDITALANSGGGRLAIVLNQSETMNGESKCVSADGIVNRVAHGTAPSFDRIQIAELANGEKQAFEIRVGRSHYPVQCVINLNLPTSQSSEILRDSNKTVSEKGTTLRAVPVPFCSEDSAKSGQSPTVLLESLRASSTSGFYFRHAGKSMPATGADLQLFCEGLLDRASRKLSKRIRRALLRTIGQVGRADRVRRSGSSNATAAANLQPVRIVTDKNAPPLRPQHVDRLYPWRQKELVQELNKRLGARKLTTYDVQAVRRQHHLDDHPEFVFHLPGAGRRYSPALADWMLGRHAIDPEFFATAHRMDQEMLRLHRRKLH